MNLNNINDVTAFFTDKGATQVATGHNGASARTAPSTLLSQKYNYFLGRDVQGNLLNTPEADGDFIGIGYLKRGSDILWHNSEILVDQAASQFTCELGTINAEGEYTKMATIGTPEGFVGTATIPEPHNQPLEEATWIVARITGTPPTSGALSFYLSYIALA